MVRDAASARVLGHVGCGLRRGCFWDLGYRIAPSAQGRGIATAGARKATDAAHHTDPEIPVVAYLLEHNAASAHVARKVGLELQSRCPDAGNPDPQAMRLTFADRPLTAAVLSAAQQ